MDILWTGFEPFDDHDYNPSRDAARRAHRATSETVASRCEIVPVRYEAAEMGIAQIFESQPPRLAIHLGLAASREHVSIERRGRNVPGERPDESGASCESPLDDDVEALETHLSVEPLADELGEHLQGTTFEGVRASNDAGTYVCNVLYCHSLRRAREARARDEDVQSLFIHVPPCSPDDARELGEAIWQVIEPHLEVS